MNMNNMDSLNQKIPPTNEIIARNRSGSMWLLCGVAVVWSQRRFLLFCETQNPPTLLWMQPTAPFSTLLISLAAFHSCQVCLKRFQVPRSIGSRLPKPFMSLWSVGPGSRNRSLCSVGTPGTSCFLFFFYFEGLLLAVMFLMPFCGFEV